MKREEKDCHTDGRVLIAPLWNWNNQLLNIQFYLDVVLIAPLWNWNAFAPSVNRETNIGSNRTFMELKSVYLQVFLLRHLVLIAPLWNWNMNEPIINWSLSIVLIAPLWNCVNCSLWRWSSNRTFMELKFRWYWSIPLLRYVLIAPLWNWNVRWRSLHSLRHSVLIAPLWNWNRIVRVREEISSCSNRTFMELKWKYGQLGSVLNLF